MNRHERRKQAALSSKRELRILHLLPVPPGVNELRLTQEEMAKAACAHCGKLLFAIGIGEASEFTGESKIHESPPVGFVKCKKG